jgi:hypothetical protein
VRVGPLHGVVEVVGYDEPLARRPVVGTELLSQDGVGNVLFQVLPTEVLKNLHFGRVGIDERVDGPRHRSRR